MRIAIDSDDAGMELKQVISEHLRLWEGMWRTSIC